MDTEALTPRDKTLLGLSQKTGLAVLTIDDLLKKGWIFAEETNKPTCWISPLLMLKKQ